MLDDRYLEYHSLTWGFRMLADVLTDDMSVFAA